jgi:hypothetical protein
MQGYGEGGEMKLINLFKKKPLEIMWAITIIVTCLDILKYAYQGLLNNMVVELIMLVLIILVVKKYDIFGK